MNNSFDNIQSDSSQFAEALAWEAAQQRELAQVEQEQEKEECRRCGYPEDYRWGVCHDCWLACGE